jgi:hypothetical protein
MTTTAARVLDEYAREWDIDQTPAITSATRAPDALGGRNDQRRRMRVFISFTTAIERDDAPLWLMFLGMPTTASSGAIVEKLPTVTINWTHAFTEAHARLQRAIERAAAATLSSKHAGSRFGCDEVRQLWTVPETPLVADTYDTFISRGQRALRATNDLANWLGMTPAKVADLLVISVLTTIG